MIGTTKSWMWWLGGLLCAAVFGGAAQAGEPVAVRYGIKIRPPAPPVKPVASAEQKKKAAELVEAYLAGKGAAAPSAAETKQIAKLISDMGADDYATREAASKAVLKYGSKALAQLKAATGSKDAEVVQRAETAIAAIRRGGAGEVVGALRRLRSAAHLVIREKQAALKKAAYKAELTAIALEAQKKTAEARKQRELAAATNRKIAELTRLYNLVVYGASVPIDRRVQPAYGIRRPIMLK